MYLLYESAEHRCVAFPDLVRGDDGIQANQFLIQHGEASALLDPGGALLYTPLSMAVARYVPLKQLTYIIASHQDPDVIGSVDRWLVYTGAKVVCSKWWGRFQTSRPELSKFIMFLLLSNGVTVLQLALMPIFRWALIQVRLA